MEKELESNHKKHIAYPNWVWIGFNTYLLAENNITELKTKNHKDNIDNFLLGISIYGDLLSHKKLKDNKDVEYCLDSSYWYYFPLEDAYSEIMKAINNKDFEKTFKEIFEKNIMTKVMGIFNKYLPDDTRRINIKVLEK